MKISLQINKNKDLDSKLKDVINKDRKIKSAVQKEESFNNSYGYFSKDKAKQEENKSISNRSANSTILENIIGFKIDSGENSTSAIQSRENKVTKNNFMVKTNLTDFQGRSSKNSKFKSKDKVIGITRESIMNQKDNRDKNTNMMNFIEEESQSASNPSVRKHKENY